MRENRTRVMVAAVALCIIHVALAAPALAGPVAFRGWRLDGTGLFVRGDHGRIEPVGSIVSAARGWDETGAASGYEDQVAGFERTSDIGAQDASGWRNASEPREWDERTPDEEALRGWWGESEDDARADDRYHAYADGAEM